jgi:DNA-binding transcriptional LysR family regulator
VELTHLQSFLAVYRERNITRAAASLHISQPAVTAHLRALEVELKRPLFVRLSRGVAPTALADQLASEVTEPINALAATAQGFRPDADLSQATLLLGGPADALSAVILPLLAPFANRGLSIRVQTGLTPDLVRALSSGELDLVVATTPTRQRAIKLTRLFDEELALTLSPRLAANLGRSIELSSIAAAQWPTLLRGVPLIAFAENAPLIRRFWRTAFGLSTAPNPKIVVDDLRAIAAAVTASVSWSVLPTYLTRDLVAHGELVTPFHPEVVPTNTLYLAQRISRGAPTVDRVVQHLVGSLSTSRTAKSTIG